MILTSLALVLPLALPAAQSADLARARQLLEEPEEGQVRQGVEACVAANDVPGVELLLGVLRRTSRLSGAHLAPAHYRDMAWGGLTRVTDVYARKRVEQELRESDDPWVRQWCAELLGIYADGDHGDALLRALGDRELGVQRAAARSLGQVGYVPAAKKLEREAKDRDPVLRANAIEALARLDAEAYRERFGKGLEDDDAGVRCALLGAVPEVYSAENEALSVRALEDEDWRPRIRAVLNLARVRTKGAVDALIGAIEDGRPIVGERAVESLQELTGERFTRLEAWQAWWKDHRETFSFPDGTTGRPGREDDRTVATYNGIRLVSDHVAFLIDRSRAMSEPLKATGTTKAEAAQDELGKVLEALDGRLVFNVFAYAEDVRVLDERRPLECDKRSKKRALEFVEKSPGGSAKDIWQLLEQVVSDPDLDTAYLLSSGEPDIGTYVHWNRVTWQLRELNRFHMVTVHTIAYSDNDWYRSQLEKIAEATGGEFQWFE